MTPSQAALIAVLLTGLSLFGTFAEAAEQQTTALPSNEYRALQADTTELSRQVDSIRRDQLNYKVEKDLLKEAYSSNLQTVNQVITLVLGVFGALGFLGIRSIRDIQQDHRRELENIRSIKGAFEDELSKLRQQQNQFDSQVKNLVAENSNQDRRLKTLEITEKVSELVRQKNYFWALQHIEAGLPLSPDDTILLNFKATCLGRLGKPIEAAAVCIQLLELEPSNEMHPSNLLEFQAIGGQAQEFEETYRRHRKVIDALNEGALTVYLRLLSLGFMGSTEALIEVALPYVRARIELPANASLGNWIFEDAQVAIAAVLDTRSKALLQSVIDYFSGVISSAAFVEILEGTKGARVS